MALAYTVLAMVLVGGVILLINHHCKRRADKTWRARHPLCEPDCSHDDDQHLWGV